MTRAEPCGAESAGSYDRVAEIYDATFEDISVRTHEVRWIERKLQRLTQRIGRPPRMLEIGCGNGALLARLAPGLGPSVGVDLSNRLVDRARERLGRFPGVTIERVDGPSLPMLEDGSVDVVVSMLSWRYLDWDPISAEIQRVARGGGELWVVDMVERRARVVDGPRMILDHVKERAWAMRRPAFRRARRRLVQDDAWRTLVQLNPMRALHEYDWYFQSRFPALRAETLSISRRARVVAYDCGVVDEGRLAEQAYP